MGAFRREVRFALNSWPSRGGSLSRKVGPDKNGTPISPRASLVITTKNRKEDLRKAIVSALRQTEPLEVLVMDDGCTDGTEQAVRREFPSVQIHRTETSQGYIVQRNRGARLARGSIIFSLDDDAAFSTPNIVEQTLADFVHPR